MKRSLLLSLSLICAFNTLAVKTAQAVDWKKVQQYSIVTIGSLVAAAAIVYGVKKLALCKAQTNPFDLPRASMNSPFATF